jgi:hypothetical protein
LKNKKCKINESIFIKNEINMKKYPKKLSKDRQDNEKNLI